MESTENQLRRRAEIDATLSSCCGFSGEVTLTDSAVILLFAGMLGAGDMLSLLTTSVLPLLNGICLIPMAGLIAGYRVRPVVLSACAIAAGFYFLAAAAPWFGSRAVVVLIGAIFLFALSLTGFIAGWFPMLDTFLTRERRTGFFSRMRFCHQLAATLFLVVVGVSIGREPSVQALQLVLGISAFIFAGRGWFISRIPDFPIPRREEPGFRAGLALAFGNRRLIRFSLYLFVLNIAGFGTVPLMLLSLKNRLGAPDNVLVLISAATLSGMLVGYLGTKMLAEKLTSGGLLVALHLLFLGINLALFPIGHGSFPVYAVVTLLLFFYSFATAAASVVASAGMMELATPGNKVMAMAVSGSFSYGGSGLARLFSSLILGAGILAPEWNLWTFAVSRYQTLLLAYAVLLVAGLFFLPLIPGSFFRRR